jgi:hypothetical protein
VTDFIDVVSHSPILFVKEVCEKIAEGYQVTNTIPGYPQFSAYGNSIRLTKSEKPSGVIIAKDHTGQVEHYDAMAFMLLVQNFVHAGYTFVEGGNHFFDEKGLKSVQMAPKQEAVVEAKQEEKPAKKAPAKKALKAEPTKDEMEGNE